MKLKSHNDPMINAFKNAFNNYQPDFNVDDMNASWNSVKLNIPKISPNFLGIPKSLINLKNIIIASFTGAAVVITTAVLINKSNPKPIDKIIQPVEKVTTLSEKKVENNEINYAIVSKYEEQKQSDQTINIVDTPKIIDKMPEYSSIKVDNQPIISNNIADNSNITPVLTQKTHIIENIIDSSVSIQAIPTPPIVYQLPEIPNVFSPNGDGINDEFYIKINSPLIIYQLNIFDRNSNIVFSSKNEKEKWNGYKNLNQCPVGTYFFIFTYQIDGQPLSTASGTITLYR